MLGYVKDIRRIAKKNKNFRQVIETGELSQIVVMSIPPGGEIGTEVHENTEQVLYIVDGKGKTAKLDRATVANLHPPVAKEIDRVLTEHSQAVSDASAEKNETTPG